MFGNLPIEVFLSMASGVGGFAMKLMAQKHADNIQLLKLGMSQKQQMSDLADAAAKRSSPVLRKIIALIIISICFGGLLIVAFFPNIPVSVIGDPEEHSILWGLISWTKTEVITAQGLVFPDWVKYSVVSVLSFLFGSGAAKTR